MTEPPSSAPQPTDADAEPTASPPDAYDTDDVAVLDVGGRRIVLVGTAHISRESVDLVRAVIERERPDCVCIELDEQRFEALSQEQRWEQLDLREVIRNRQLTTLLANLLLSSYQKRLGGKLGVKPGSELLEAAQVAEANDIPISLCDREIRITLRRAWASLPWYRKLWLASTLGASAFEGTELSEEDLRELKQRDVLNELMRELGEAFPDLKRVLIDERDTYLAQRIRESDGQRLVAVVGAGHVAGMRDALESGREDDLTAIEEIPEASPVWRWIGWAIPALIVGAIVYIGATQGPEAAGENALVWFLANAIPSAIGGALALGHPFTIVAAALSAPFTSLSPLIGAGYVAAFVQVWAAPPLVREFNTVGDDIGTVGRWWQSRLLRLFLVFLFVTLGSVIGTWVGGAQIVSNVVGSGG